MYDITWLRTLISLYITVIFVQDSKCKKSIIRFSKIILDIISSMIRYFHQLHCQFVRMQTWESDLQTHSNSDESSDKNATFHFLCYIESRWVSYAFHCSSLLSSWTFRKYCFRLKQSVHFNALKNNLKKIEDDVKILFSILLAN